MRAQDSKTLCNGASSLSLMSRYIADESGATAIEYGLMASLIGVGAIKGMTTLGGSLNERFSEIAILFEGSAEPPSAGDGAP